MLPLQKQTPGFNTTSNNEIKFEGIFENSQIKSGTCHWPDGRIYSGNFFEGNPHGEGAMSYANNDIYTGSWKNGREHGEGIYVYANGKTITGVWKDGLIESEEDPHIEAGEGF